MEGFDLSTASGIYMGSSVISALYLGSLLIWPTNYQEEYLTITSMNGAWTQDDRENTIKFMTSDPSYVKYIEVSRDKVHWTTYASSVNGTQIGTIRKGQKLYIRGDNSSYATSIDYYTSFWATGIFNVSGNIMALIDSENFREMTTLTQPYALAYIFRDAPVIDASNLYLPATTLTSSCYRGMFNLSSLQIPPRQLPATTLTESCYREMFYQTALEDVPELPATTLADSCYSSMFNSSHITAAPELPATTLASRCYDGMFANCSYLQLPPELPATTLAAHCYDGMFALCTSLRIVDTQMLPATTLAVQCYAYMFESCRSITMAPILPATTLAQGCYWGMFRGCTSLTTAPTLPATTLTDSCYEWMFYNCTSLSTISMLAADISANDCLFEWVYNVASSGTFIKAPEQTSLRINDVSGIPRGWTVESRYVIHIVNTTGGQLVISRPYASPGQTVWVGTVEDEGYDFDYMSVVDSQGNPVSVSGKTFVMPSSSVTVTGYWVSYESMYLTIESLEGDNNVYWKASNSSYTASIEWSFNKTNWTSVTSTTSGNMLATLHTGFKLYLRGTVPGYNDYYNYLVTTKSVKAYGNILSIVDGSNFITNPSSTTGHSVHYLFYNCTHLTDASNIILPNDVTFNGYESMFEGCTSLTAAPALPATYLYLSSSCYQNMFKGCTSLTTAPALPATALSSSCYKGMFEGCTSLATAPALPALGLATACYYGMFKGCTSLETAPDLLASTLQEQCYYYMFDGCTSLNSIKMAAKYLYSQSSTPATYSLTNWVRNVAATGTFYKAESMTSLTVGDSGIPTGWITENILGQYTISITQSQNGTVTSNTQRADYGDRVTLTITPDSGYELDTLTVLDANSNPITVTNNQFIMPNSNVTVSASFATDYSITISPSQNGTVTSDVQSATHGTTVTLTITPDSGYELSVLTVLDANSNPVTVTNNQFIMPNSNVTVSASFVQINYNTKYLTIVSLDYNNVISWKTNDASYTQDIQYSTDLINWTTVTSTTSGATLATLDLTDRLYLKGSLVGHNSGSYYDYINSSGYINVEGNIMSLTNGDNFANATSLTQNYQLARLFYNCIRLNSASNLKLPATTLTQGCYGGMFNGCVSLTTAPTLPATTLTQSCYASMFNGCTSLTTAPTLPATTLTNSCYVNMFQDCTSLTTAPTLPATTLAMGCYGSMFNGCTSLTTAPELPATTLAMGCYGSMFNGCTSLTTAPELPATTLALYCYNNMFKDCTSLTTAPSILPATTINGHCYDSMFYGCTSLTTAPELPDTDYSTVTPGSYNNMFYGCSSLNYIKCLLSRSYTLNNWVYGVAATGTFIKAGNVSWNTGDSGIPTGWTVINYYETQYLTIESQADNNTISWKSGNASYTQDIQYSIDKTNWTTVTSTRAGATLTTLNNGDKLYLKGSLVGHNSANYYEYFTSSGNFKVYGNIMSLTNGDNFASATSLTQNYQLARLFSSSKVTNISNLIMPATTLTRYCYQNMFNGCTQLTTAATKLPATSVEYYSYASMFQGCTSLVTPPVLCGITLGGYAYSTMFAGCTSLTRLPRLADATTITSWAPYRYMFGGCTGITDARYDVNGDRLLPTHLTVSSGGSAFELMFQNCTNIQYAPELTDMTPHHGEYNQMFKGCTSLYSIITHASSLGTANFGAIVENTGHVGTVYKAKDVTWDTSQYSQFNYTSGSAWTVIDGDYNAGDYQT